MLVPRHPDAALLFIKDDWQYLCNLSFSTPAALYKDDLKRTLPLLSAFSSLLALPVLPLMCSCSLC